ncbi:glycosyltransferase family 4 protein [Candidatus Woesearchaeota archaeon]|nr:glycosyltransferase family 4 protein [Candidatus Woesearchaeota archaeon]
MRKIKVLMLGWEYPPYVTGGLGTHCYYLTKALAKLPVKIYFITPHPIHKRRGNLEIIGLDISQRFKEDGKILSYGKRDNFYKKVELYKKEAVDVIQKLDFDIIHSQDWMPIETAILIKNLSGKPLIQTMHSTEFDKCRHPRKRFIELDKKGMKAAEKVIAVSNYTKKILIDKFGIESRKIAVIYNAIEQRKAPAKKKEATVRHILYLGRLKYQKGIPFLIDAADIVLKKERDVRFIIAGKGKKEYEAKLKIKVHKLGHADKIIFKGYVKDKDYYYKKANLFVMPSLSEPFGITPLESIGNGTPVLISKQSGIAEVLKSCLKFDYGNKEDFARKMLFLLRNKRAYERLRTKGLEEIRSFTWESIAKETRDVYAKFIS